MTPTNPQDARDTTLSRRMLLSRAAAFGVSGGALSVLAACGGSGSGGGAQTGTPATSQKGGVLRVAVAQNFEDFDPQRSPFGNYPFIHQLYDPVVQDYNQPDAADPKPELGELVFAKDSSSVDVRVQEGITFHSGAPVDADAIVANVRKALDKVKGADTRQAWEPLVADVKKLDAQTARVRFKDPAPAAYVSQLFSLLPLVSPALIDQYDRIKTRADGTGPFELVEYRQGDRAILERNPNYWKDGLPLLDGIEFRFFTDADAQVDALQSGGADFLFSAPFSRVPSLKTQYELIVGPPALTMELVLSADRGRPFESQESRQAMQYLVDRQRFVQEGLFATGQVAAVHVDPKNIAFDPRFTERYSYDPDRARQMFAQLGMLNQRPIKMMQVTGVLPEIGMLAEVVAENMNSIGLRTELEPVDVAVWAERAFGADAGNYDMFTSFMGRGNRYPIFQAQGNISLAAIENPTFPDSEPPAAYTEAYQQLFQALDEAAQRRWGLQMEEAILDGSWSIAVAYRPSAHFATDKVSGYQTTRDDHPIMERVSLQS